MPKPNICPDCRLHSPGGDDWLTRFPIDFSEDLTIRRLTHPALIVLDSAGRWSLLDLDNDPNRPQAPLVWSDGDLYRQTHRLSNLPRPFRHVYLAAVADHGGTETVELGRIEVV